MSTLRLHEVTHSAALARISMKPSQDDLTSINDLHSLGETCQSRSEKSEKPAVDIQMKNIPFNKEHSPYGSKGRYFVPSPSPSPPPPYESTCPSRSSSPSSSTSESRNQERQHPPKHIQLSTSRPETPFMSSSFTTSFDNTVKSLAQKDQNSRLEAEAPSSNGRVDSLAQPVISRAERPRTERCIGRMGTFDGRRSKRKAVRRLKL